MIALPNQSKTSVTKERLKEWSACADGYRWFLERFPGGGEFAAVYNALIKDGRCSDADWLVGKALDGIDTAERVNQIAIISGADSVAIADAVARGANAATTGNRANAATTGEGANAATTGNRANAATTGNRANAATTGNRANAATTGNGANAATTGEGAIAAALGINARARAGVGGAIVLAHRSDDGVLLGVVAAMVGGDVKPDIWYVLDADGRLTECANQ